MNDIIVNNDIDSDYTIARLLFSCGALKAEVRKYLKHRSVLMGCLSVEQVFEWSDKVRALKAQEKAIQRLKKPLTIKNTSRIGNPIVMLIGKIYNFDFSQVVLV